MAILLYSQCGDKSIEKDTISGVYFLNHDESVNYVGMQACAVCHMDKVNSFMHTGMGQSFDLARPGKSAAEFGDKAHVYDAFLDLHYRAYWEDSTLYIMEYRVNATGDTLYSRVQKIDYIIGSGQHTNSHLFRMGEFLYQAPMTWYSQEGKWDLPPGFENGLNTRFSRQLDVECISCHNAMPVMAKGSDRAFIQIGDGINCERCHGPGELHVKFRSKGGIVEKGKVDSTIVNPSRLTPNLQIDVCQRCHLQGNNVLVNGKRFTDFRPGMRLKDFFEVYSPEYKGDKVHFNMADHSERMQMSRCYQATKDTRNQMTCITCHNPHVSVRETGNAYFNMKCKSCHTQGSANCIAPMADRQAVMDNCVQCHMPLSGSKDIPHVSVHDHRIAVPAGAPIQSRELIGLYAVNNDNPELRTKIRAYLTYYEKFTQDPFYLEEASKMLSGVNDPVLKVHLLYLRRDWKGIIQAEQAIDDSGRDAMTWYRTGKAHSQEQNLVKALVHYQKALAMRSDIHEFYNDLGVVQLRLDHLDDAIRTLERGLSKFPNEATLLSNTGYAYFLKKDRPIALQYYRTSNKLNPDHLPTLSNLAQWYLSAKDYAAARRYLTRILDLDPGNKDATYILKEMDSGGQFR